MSLLSPAFLFGLLAVGIPVLIHLVHRERRQTMEFPSLMFLSRIPHRTVRRQKLRHLWLLAMRCLGLVLLTLAFARPVLEAGGAAAALQDGARGVVLALDRSWSMAGSGRWERALAAARDEVAGLRPGDEVGVVLFDEQAEAVATLSAEPAAARAALSAAAPGSRGTRFSPALKLAARMLEEAGHPRPEVVLISDFQRRGIDGLDEVILPPGTAVRTADVGGEEIPNRGISDVTFQRVYEGGRERVAASVRIVSQGAPGPVSARLELEGRELQTKSAELPEEGAETLHFDPLALPPGEQRGAVHLESDGLTPDDSFRFVLSPGQELRVLLVEESGERRNHSLFLRRALAVGNRPRFRVREERRSQLTANAFDTAQVVLLNDAAWPAGAAGERLGRFLDEGGGLVAALAARTGPRDWSGSPEGLLGGELGSAAVDRGSDWGGTLAYIDYDHPAFSLFRAPRSGDLSQARFLRYRSLELREDAGVLARFDDGRPALVERSVGEGRVLLWTSSFDTLWNDLPLKPVFLPLLHRLLIRAADYTESPASHRAGDVLELPPLESSEGWVGQSPSGERVRLEGGDRYLELAEAGFYEMRQAGDEALAPLVSAVNVDAAESDRARVDPEELAGGLSRVDDAVAAGEGTTRAASPGGEVAWALVLVAVGLLMAETALSNRLSRPAA